MDNISREQSLNKSSNLSLTIAPNEGALRSGKVTIQTATNPDLSVEYIVNQDAGEAYARKQKHIKALRALYDATNGDRWKRSDNWFTDKPLYEWYGLNANLWPESTIKRDEVVEIQLFDNNLSGSLPAEFADLMDDAQYIDINGNAIEGQIPKEVKEHPKWQQFGWDVLMQSLWSGSGFDFSDGTGLVVPDGKMTFFTDGTSIDSKDVMSAHELTFVINAGFTDDYKGAPMDLHAISDKWINYFLDYHNKGFSLIVTVGRFFDNTFDDSKKYVLQKQEEGLPKDILWCENVISYFAGLSGMGSGEMHLFDKNGDLLGCWARDYAIPDTWYIEQVDPFVRSRLGEPEEHPEYNSFYTSTDYSQDGEVIILQQATKGKGIDVVFMGDAYVDKHMNNGEYEQDMRASMEYFFEAEPYKSLRDRFNVYAVKVVSPNYAFTSESVHRINYDNATCFEYASKIEGIDLDKVTIVNVVNSNNSFFAGGYTNMYTSGASVAHIEIGGPSSIIAHEAGGHGFAKLLDEYIYGGYENYIIPDEEVANFNSWIKTTYHDLGWGMNVDTTNNPERIIWSHLLSDSRYTDEVGIYQGAWLYPFNLWRPSENSIMLDSFCGYFNAPSREAIYKAVMTLSEGDGWVYDYEEFVRFDKSVSTRSSTQQSATPESRKIKRKEHKAPTIIQGSWRDALKSKQQN